jgi:hypothetical protein|tara:strand:- start:572 stop:781 length:210 start_codon:yes stop_codon:yes gene_type:complete
MNGIFNFVRFVTYSIAGVAIRKSWNWLTEDVDPVPGTKEFNKEFYETETKYKRLKIKKGAYDEANRKSR